MFIIISIIMRMIIIIMHVLNAHTYTRLCFTCIFNTSNNIVLNVIYLLTQTYTDRYNYIQC